MFKNNSLQILIMFLKGMNSLVSASTQVNSVGKANTSVGIDSHSRK